MSRSLPGEAWDCHAHVFEDPRIYPLASLRSYDPPPAPLEAYLEMLDRCGLARGILVQPSVYGFDNRCLLDALDRAQGRLLGVVAESGRPPSPSGDPVAARPGLPGRARGPAAGRGSPA